MEIMGSPQWLEEGKSSKEAKRTTWETTGRTASLLSLEKSWIESSWKAFLDI